MIFNRSIIDQFRSTIMIGSTGGKNFNCSVSLERCDNLQVPIVHTNNNVKIISVYPKDNVVIDETAENVKRSTRLSKKRSVHDKSFMRDNARLNDVKKRKCTANNLQINKNKSGPSESVWNITEKITSPRVFTKINLTNNDISKASNVQTPLNTTDDNETTVPTKYSLKTLSDKILSRSINSNKNKSTAYNVNNNDDDVLSNDLEKSDNFVLKRKRGRPLLKKSKEQNTSDVMTPYDNKDDGITELGSSKELDGSVNVPQKNDKPSTIGKNLKRLKLSAVNFKTQTNESCSAEITSSSETDLEPAKSSKTIDTQDQHSCLDPVEREIFLISKRFNIPAKTLRKMILEQSVLVFNEKYSKSITPSMITVSPIVVMNAEIGSKQTQTGNSKNETVNIEYKVEPIRASVVYEKTNLKDLMDELSKTMPSWSLSVVPNTQRYVISQTSIDMNGVPIMNKSILLDKYFRALVFINQCTTYKYCKRYGTVSEIVDLIKELNAV